MEVTVPTLECVTEPQPYCGVDTDGRTWTRLPTWRVCEHADQVEDEEAQAVAPAVDCRRVNGTGAYAARGDTLMSNRPSVLTAVHQSLRR